MSEGLKVERPFHIGRGGKGRKQLRNGEAGPSPPSRIPRVSRLMALAIRFEQLLRDAVVADQAELARLGYVSRARLTQIMNLLNLAPDIQEDVLFLQWPDGGRAPISERNLRPIAAVVGWRGQRALWQKAARNEPRRGA